MKKPGNILHAGEIELSRTEITPLWEKDNIDRSSRQVAMLELLVKQLTIPYCEECVRELGPDTLLWTWRIITRAKPGDPDRAVTAKGRERVIANNEREAKKTTVSNHDLLVLADYAGDLGLKAYRLVSETDATKIHLEKTRKRKGPVSQRTIERYRDRHWSGEVRLPTFVAQPEHYYLVSKVIVWCEAE